MSIGICFVFFIRVDLRLLWVIVAVDYENIIISIQTHIACIFVKFVCSFERITLELFSLFHQYSLQR